VEAGKRRLDEIIDEARMQREQDPGGLAVRAELIASHGDGRGLHSFTFQLNLSRA
jgi:hypothetical protein